VRLLALVALFAGCQANEQNKNTARASCERVAETLASFELGNYADKEKRAPTVAKYRDQCASKGVSTKEAECLYGARDTWSARACVPSMFPTGAATGDCKQAIARMREVMLSALGSAAGSATEQLDKMIPVIQLSCEQDKWPVDVTQCMVASPPNDVAAFQKCTSQLSQELQEKMQKRMLAREQTK